MKTIITIMALSLVLLLSSTVMAQTTITSEEIVTGGFYTCGYVVEGPYVVTGKPVNGKPYVYINGLQSSPDPLDPKLLEGYVIVTGDNLPAEMAEQPLFMEEGWCLQEELEIQGATDNEIMIALMEHYASRPDLVQVHYDLEQVRQKALRGEKIATSFTVQFINQPFVETIELRRVINNPTVMERLEKKVARTVKHLQRGHLLLVDPSVGSKIFNESQREALERDIAAARSGQTNRDGELLSAASMKWFAHPVDRVKIQIKED